MLLDRIQDSQQVSRAQARELLVHMLPSTLQADDTPGAQQAQEVKPPGSPQSPVGPLSSPGASSCHLSTSGWEAPRASQAHKQLPNCLPVRGWALWAETGSFLFYPHHLKPSEKQT